MYDIKRTSIQGDYSLIQGDQEIFVFKAGKMLSSTSEAYYLGQHIEIRKQDSLSRTHQVFRDGELIAEIVVDWWHANATIRVQDLAGNLKSLSLKRRGMFSQTFDLVCQEPALSLLTIDFNLRIAQLNFTYNLRVPSAGAKLFDIPELIIYCMHALRRYRRMSGNG